MVAQQNGPRVHAVFLRNLEDVCVLEQRRARASQRAVRRDVDAFCPAEIDNLLLGQKRVVLNLIDGGHNRRLGKKLLEIFDRVIGDANGLDLVRVCLDELLEVLPCLDVVGAVVNVTRTVFELGEEGMVA